LPGLAPTRRRLFGERSRDVPAPRGDTGNVEETPLFIIPVPSSRGSVPTGYDYVLPDQNGWSRYLHFESAWLLGFTGLAYLVAGVRSGHLRRNLMPAPAELRWSTGGSEPRSPPCSTRSG
jgi:hypothetical protein